jgi:hypothetical protein
MYVEQLLYQVSRVVGCRLLLVGWGGDPEQQVTLQAKLPREHQVGGRNACGLVGRYSIGRGEDWWPLLPIPLVHLNHLLQVLSCRLHVSLLHAVRMCRGVVLVLLIRRRPNTYVGGILS